MWVKFRFDIAEKKFSGAIFLLHPVNVICTYRKLCEDCAWRLNTSIDRLSRILRLFVNYYASHKRNNTRLFCVLKKRH